jgi:HAMP domain-containing protein
MSITTVRGGCGAAILRASLNPGAASHAPHTAPAGEAVFVWSIVRVTRVSFPSPVNENAAPVVAGGGFVLSRLTLVTGAYGIAATLAYGFVARVLTGPTLSPLGQVATRVVATRLGTPRLVPSGRQVGRPATGCGGVFGALRWIQTNQTVPASVSAAAT